MNAIKDNRIYLREPLFTKANVPVFSSPNTYTENYETISADHIKSLQETGANPFIPEYLWQQMEESTIGLIQRYSTGGETILDVGVGLGRVLSHFPSLSRHGMDISFGYLDIARSKGIDVCYSLIEEMPYRKEFFDIVVCTDVLEHVFDLHLSCEKILSVLKEGGVLIARVPYRENLREYLDPDYPYEFAHVRNFDEYSLRLLFESIFRCEVLLTEPACYASPIGFDASTRLKCPVSFRGRDRLLSLLFSLLRASSQNLYEAVLHKFYYPVEISAVIRKTRSNL